MFIGFLSCEKIDPLSEQGTLTGVEVPNAILSTIAATAAEDTITLSTTCWAVDDNIAKVEYAHKGYKSSTLAISWTVKIDDETSYDFSESFNTDTTFIDSVLITSITSLDEFYQTFMSAYVVKYDFIIPNDYIITNSSGKKVITDMSVDHFQKFVNLFAAEMNKEVVEELFTIEPEDLDTYFVKEDDVYTGALTSDGVQYVKDNLTKDVIKSKPSKSSVTAFAESTIFSITTLSTNASSIAEKSFEILASE